jgi:hypothetical protein
MELFHVTQKNIFSAKVAQSSKIGYHTIYQNPILRADFIALSSEFCPHTMLYLMNVGN